MSRTENPHQCHSGVWSPRNRPQGNKSYGNLGQANLQSFLVLDVPIRNAGTVRMSHEQLLVLVNTKDDADVASADYDQWHTVGCPKED